MKPVFTRLTALLLAPLAALHAADTPKPYGKSKPNIVIILADDLGYGDVGFNGQVKFKTPNIDKMTRDGVRMANFYSGAPVCGPSRAALMYGQHTGHNPIRRNPGWTASGKGPQMGVDDIIIPKELKRAGYTTAVIGKWALNDDLKSNTGHPLKQGFDLFYGFNTHGEAHEHWPDFIWDGETKVILNKGIKGGNWTNKYAYADDLFQKKALDYIEQQDAKTPFFMYLNFTIPHKGYSVPQESRLPYENLGWPKEIKGSGYNNDPDAYSAYAGMISRMDGYVGEIRAKLEALGIAENTLIIFTSDNGHEFSSNFFNSGGGFKGKKRDLFEGGIHAPTAISV